MLFSDFKYIVLCDELFDAGFIKKTDAFNYMSEMIKAYPSHTYRIFDVDDGDERELDRIWYSYELQEEELDR